MSDEKTVAKVWAKDSYSPPSEVLERAYQPKAEIAQVPDPPAVGSTAVVPSVVPSTATEGSGSSAPTNQQE
jgi:hypothetical protein